MIAYCDVFEIFRWSMGSPEKAVLFITQCLYMDRKIDVSSMMFTLIDVLMKVLLQVTVEVPGPPVMKIGENERKDH